MNAARPAPARPPRARRGVAAALIVALGALLAGCGGDGDGGSTDRIVVVPADRREEPVPLSGTTLEGTPLDVAALRGRLVVVNVWGSWCGPCRKEAPELERARQRLAADDVAFVGVTSRDDRAQALAFQRRFGVGYPSIDDRDGTVLLGLRGAVSANSVPTTLVLDDRGRIAARISGATTEATLVDVVSDVAGREVGAAGPTTASPTTAGSP